MEIDELDAQILKALLADGRLHFTKLATELNVSTGTINQRFEKMTASGVIKSSTLTIDYSALGYDVCAFIGINLNQAGDYPKVLAKLKKIDRITDAYYTTGAYNIFSRVWAKNIADLYSFLLEIQKIKEIHGTETIMILDKPIERSLTSFQSR